MLSGAKARKTPSDSKPMFSPEGQDPLKLLDKGSPLSIRFEPILDSVSQAGCPNKNALQRREP